MFWKWKPELHFPVHSVSISETLIRNIWIPTAVEGKKILFLSLSREGNYTRSPDSLVEEINMFRGEDNRINFQRVYTKTFKVKIRIFKILLCMKKMFPHPCLLCL